MRNSGVGNDKIFSSFEEVANQSEDKPNELLGNLAIIIDRDDILQLKTSLEKLKGFIENLGGLKETIMVDCVTSLYSTDEVENLTSEKVLKAANERVEKYHLHESE